MGKLRQTEAKQLMQGHAAQVTAPELELNQVSLTFKV